MNEMVCKKDAGKTEIKHPGGIPIDLVIPPRFDNEDQLKNEPFTLESAVGSQKSAQALGAPGKIKKCRITTEVPTNFFISPGTPISSTFVLRPTAVSRFTT